MFNPRLKTVLAAACLLAWGGLRQIQEVRAQAIITNVAVAGQAADDGWEDEPESDPAQQPGMNGLIDESNFEAWIWNGTVNSADAGRARLMSQLDLLIAEIVRACGLSPAQERKLRLAGTIDVKRFFERYEALRKRFLKVRGDQRGLNNFLMELQPLQLEIQSGLFNEESLLLRTVHKTLIGEQLQQYDAETKARARYRLEAKLDLLIVAADESLGLRIEQRDKLLKLCREKVRPPRRFGQYDSYVIMYELSKIPEAEVRAILDETQLNGWKQSMNQFRGMEQFLRQNKLLDDSAVPEVPVPREEPAKAGAEAGTATPQAAGEGGAAVDAVNAVDAVDAAKTEPASANTSDVEGAPTGAGVEPNES